MTARVGKDIVALAENQILSAEELTTGEIALYSRFIGEDEEREILKIAENGPGDNDPTKTLISLIKEKATSI